MALFSWRRKCILVKLEVTYGTDPVPTAMANGVLAMNLTISLEADKLEREIDRPFFTANPFVLVGRKAIVEFDFEPLGAAVAGAAAPCGPILEACAHAQVLTTPGPPADATYNPISTGIKSCTIHYYMGDQRFALVGCRGSINFDLAIKTFPKARARMVGQFAIPTAAAIVSPTTTNWQDPPAIETETWSVTVNGTPVNTTGLQFDQANEVNMYEGSESRTVEVMDRRSNGTLRVYDPGVGVLDFWTLARNHTKVPIVSIIDGGAGKKFTATLGLVQFEMPKFSEMEKAVGLEIPFHAIASGAGSDEYLLKFD